MLYIGRKHLLGANVKRIFRHIALLSGTCGALAATPMAMAERSTQTTSFGLRGAAGIIEMPTAEVAPDGTLSFSYSSFGNITFGTLNFQITPRLSGSFRYSGLTNFDPNYDTYTDRAFDLSYRLFDETDILPAVSVGINDLLGTGLYSSEYVVATKSIGENIRVTGGLGWGRLGSLGGMGSPFGDRPDFEIGFGGTPNYTQWFRGPVAFFGGATYDVNDKITLLAEYSSDAYSLEAARGTFTPLTPFNFGASYKFRPGVNVSAYYLRGSTFGLSFNLMANPNSPAARSGTEQAPLPVRPRPSRSADPESWGTDWVSDPAVEPGIRSALAAALTADGITLEAMSLSATRAEIRISNNRYGAQAQAIGRATRMMTRAFPASVETFVITSVANGLPIGSVILARSDVEALEHAPAPDIFSRAVFTDVIGDNGQAVTLTPGVYPSLTWSLQPYMNVALFNPDAPVGIDGGLRLSGQYKFAPGLVLSGAITAKLAGNLDVSYGVNDSVLPHVRSDVAEYSAQGNPAIEKLTLSWYSRPGRNLYGRVTAGYLESMFAGVSTEVLWKPVDSSFALGAELAFVQQRDFNQLLGLRDYQTITGHITGYYDFGNGFTSQVGVGRYLAGDYGGTVAVDRVFANGWKVGAFATLTNLSPEEFGEGTFDKGIRLSIPLEWALGSPTRSVSTTEMRSLSSDGGAILQVDGRLFDWVQEGHASALSQRWGKFWR